MRHASDKIKIAFRTRRQICMNFARVVSAATFIMFKIKV